MTVADHTLEVDWAAAGSFAGTYDDVSARVRTAPGIRSSRGKDQIRALAPPAAGHLDAELDNRDRVLSAENSLSPLAGDLVPGRAVRWQVDFNSITYDLWRGLLDDLPQLPDPAVKAVALPCLGTFSRLTGISVSTALYADILTSTAIGHVLDAVGWPAADRVIDTGKTTLRWWWLDGEDAFSALRDLLASEGPGASIYEDAQGRFVFESRHYRLLTARCTTSQATFRDDGAEPLYAREGFRYDAGRKSIIDNVTMEVKTRSAKASAVVWSLGSTLTLAPLEVRTVQAAASDPFTAAIVPVLATDYTLSSGSLTSLTLSRTSGASTIITLTASSAGAVVAGLQLRAQPVTVDNTALVAASDPSGPGAGERRALVIGPIGGGRGGGPTSTSFVAGRGVITARAEIDLNVAQDFVNTVVTWYRDPRPQVTIVVDNHHDTAMTQALTREISDRVTIIEPQTGLNADFFLEQITQESDDCIHKATFGCEKATDTASYFVLDTSELDGVDVLGW